MTTDTLVGLLIQGARISPEKTAIRSADSCLTFAELMDGSARLASALRRAGVRPGDRVGVWMDKTPNCVLALVGIMRAGAAYVPLDPKAPWRRCRMILQDCGVAAVLADGIRIRQLPDLLEGLTPRLVVIEGPGGPGETSDLPVASLADVLAGPSEDLPEPAPEDVAYILYTSGSTGTPKGVVHTHRSGLAFADWVRKTYDVVADDVFSSHAPFHFDLSISDLYASLGSGASVRLISSVEAMLPPYLVKSVAEWGITVWYSVPSILTAMLETGGLEKQGFGAVRVLLFAGEVFPTPQLRRLRKALPNVRLSNLFGPTETNVCTYYDVPADIPADRPIPIGRGCEHLETFVLDDDGREVGVGVVGTLWVIGGNLMSGYWNDPERTSATLAPDPRGGGALAYCTGDRVRLQADGNYEFLGRRDHMIKVRGFRVEAGEIEAALTAHPDVLEAVIVALPDEKSGSRIVTTVMKRTGSEVTEQALRAFCTDRLPIYMIPEQFEIVTALPRTSTGKADRQALTNSWSRRR